MLLSRNRTQAFDTVSPIYAIENNKIIFRDGRVGIGFLVHSPEMETWSKPLYEQAQDTLAGMCKHLPAHTIIQKTDIYYHAQSIQVEAQDKFFTTRQKQKFLDSVVLQHRSYLFLSFAPAKAKKVTPTNALNALIVRAGEAIQKNPFADLAETMEVAARSASEVVSTLRSLSGVGVEQLGKDELENVYSQYFNLSFNQDEKAPYREISNTRAGLQVGEHMVNVVSMIGQGTQAVPVVANTYHVVSPMLYSLTHFLNFPHITTQAVMVTDSRKELKSLDSDRKINDSLGVLGNQDSEVRVQELKKFTAEVRASNKVLTKLHVSVLVWEQDNALRKERIDLVLTAFRLMFGAEAVVESMQALHMLFGLAPGNAAQIPDRWITTSADRAACYLHWTTTYRPEPYGDLICDRFGHLVRVNLFNTEHQNMNSVVVGPSGSGKSYTYGYFIVQRHERGARQFIIDNGGTYRNVMQFLTGADFDKCYHEYDPASPLAFNPFLVERGEKDKWLYTPQRQVFHLAFFALLLKKKTSDGQGAVGLSKPEEALLSRMLMNYYRFLNEQSNLGQHDEIFPGMQSFYEFAKRNDERLSAEPTNSNDLAFLAEHQQYLKDGRLMDMHQFFTIVEQFVAGGRYEAVFNAREDKDLSEYQLICFDLKEVKQDATLYPLVGLLITQMSIDLFAKYEDDAKFVAMDEAWSLLAGLEAFIEAMYRTIRKLNGSITIITQASEDIVKSPISAAIIANTNNFIILPHKPGPQLERLQDDFGLSGHEMDLIRSMRDLPNGREVFIKQESRGKVYLVSTAVHLDPVLTSTAWQRNYLNRLIAASRRETKIAARDMAGQLVLDVDGNLTYETISSPRLGLAVDRYVEDKLAHRGPFQV
jgi:conjugal transfer ATP-binding protein TraC